MRELWAPESLAGPITLPPPPLVLELVLALRDIVDPPTANMLCCCWWWRCELPSAAAASAVSDVSSAVCVPCVSCATLRLLSSRRMMSIRPWESSAVAVLVVGWWKPAWCKPVLSRGMGIVGVVPAPRAVVAGAFAGSTAAAAASPFAHSVSKLAAVAAVVARPSTKSVSKPFSASNWS
jgi:hypothetical protein